MGGSGKMSAKEESHSNSSDEDDSDGGGDRPEPSETPAFSEGEKVLAFHGPHLYEAKVQKVEVRKREWKYFVHYHGWNKNWDEWIGMDRLMKFNDENVKKQKALLKKQGLDKNIKAGRAAPSKPKNSTDSKPDKEDSKNLVKGKKRKGGPSIEKDDEAPDNLIKIQFPSSLQKQLVDDWKFVTQLGKLVKLPRAPNVDDILRSYLEQCTKRDGMISDSLGEMLNGLRCYFDKSLPKMLLYKQERQQYQDAIPQDSLISPSTIYGAEHLLRLFVKFPELLAYVNMEEETLTQLQQKLLDFLKFLQKKQSAFLLSSYEGPRVSEIADRREEG